MLNRLGEVDGPHPSRMPVVPWPKPRTVQPPGGGVPGGTNSAPPTTLGLPLLEVERYITCSDSPPRSRIDASMSANGLSSTMLPGPSLAPAAGADSLVGPQPLAAIRPASTTSEVRRI